MAQWFDITANAAKLKKGDVPSLMAAWGLTYDSSDPYASFYKQAIDKARPAGQGVPYASGSNWDSFTEMCLRARTMFFADTKIGDCGFTVQGGGGFGVVQGLGLAEVGLGATSAISSAANVATSFAKEIPIIGSIVGIAADIFSGFSQHHAQAVAQEKQALCGITSGVAQSVAQIYASLDSGTISTSDAAKYMASIATQVANSLKQITKNCNDSCGYIAILQAHIAFISSLSSSAAPQPAASSGLSGVASSVSNAISNLFGGSSGSSTGTTGVNWLLPALVVLVLFLLLWGRKE